MAEPATKRWTLDEFLAWDDGTDTRYELVDGQVVAMAPPTRGHGALTTRLAVAIASRLRPPCEAITEAGIVPTDRADRYHQADIAVTCTPQPADARHTADPILIVEVLSLSTADHGRGRKLADYPGLFMRERAGAASAPSGTRPDRPGRMLRPSPIPSRE